MALGERQNRRFIRFAVQAGQGSNTRWRHTGLLQEGCQAIGERCDRNATLAPYTQHQTPGTVPEDALGLQAVEIRNQAIGNPYHGVKTLCGKLRDLARKGYMRRESQAIEPTPCAAHFLDNGHGFAIYQRQRGSLEAFNWFCHPAKPLLQHIEAQAADHIRGRSDHWRRAKIPCHRARQGIGAAFVAGKNGNHKLAGFIDGHHTGICGLVSQVRRNQSRYGSCGQKENELLIAAEEPGDLCR